MDRDGLERITGMLMEMEVLGSRDLRLQEAVTRGRMWIQTDSRLSGAGW